MVGGLILVAGAVLTCAVWGGPLVVAGVSIGFLEAGATIIAGAALGFCANDTYMKVQGTEAAI